MSSIRLSIILPFHTQNSFLDEAIKSCLQAISDDCEVILMNTSHSKLNLEITDKRIVIINVPGFKYIEALSAGINSAQGTYIALMNSDDLISKFRFREQIALISKEKTNLVFCDIQKFKGKGKSVFPILGEMKGIDYRSEFLLLGSYGANASWLFLADWARDVDLFNPDLDSSDWTTALRVFPYSKVSYLPEKLYYYRMHKNQVTRISPEKHLKLAEYWGALNRNIGLPELSISEIRRLTHPHAFFNPKIDNTNIFLWVDEFLEFISHSESVRGLVERRLFLLGLSSPYKNRELIKPSIMLKFAYETLWNFNKPRPVVKPNNLT